jgi:drug/metabolite transporter (DMT)-like permease
MSEEKKGEFFIFSQVPIWACFPIVTALSYAHVPPLISLGWSTLFSAFLFAVLVAFRGRWRELANPLLWRYAVLIAFFIGFLFYGLYFFGLAHTSPGNAALIAQLEIFTSFLFFNIIRKEAFSLSHRIGAALMIIGAGLVLAPNMSGVNMGDILIFAAVFIPPFGNLYQQKARKLASSESVMLLRSVLACLIIFPLAYISGERAAPADLIASLPFLALNGFLILGLSKIFWIEAIHRISVTKANALSSLSPFVTLLIAWIVLSQEPTVWQISSLIPLIIGTLLLTRPSKPSALGAGALPA